MLHKVKAIKLGFYRKIFFDEIVDWNRGMLDSYGISGKAETPQACRGGERISPHGKRAFCNGNQHHSTPFTKI